MKHNKFARTILYHALESKMYGGVEVMSDLIGKTIPGNGMESIFKEVPHQETLGLKNPEQLRLFHLHVSNNRFIFWERCLK